MSKVANEPENHCPCGLAAGRAGHRGRPLPHARSCLRKIGCRARRGGRGARRRRRREQSRGPALPARRRHGDRLQYRHRAQPDPGPAHPDRVHRRADRQGRRPARPDRSEAVPGAARPDDRQSRSGSGATRQCDRQSRPLYGVREQGLCNASTVRHAEGASRPVAERDQGRRGADRAGRGPARLYKADLADPGSHRRAADRCRQHHPSDGPQWPRGGHAGRTDLTDLHVAASGAAADPDANGQRSADRDCLQPGRQDQAGRGQAAPGQQSDCPDDRHHPAQGNLSKRRASAMAGPAGQRAAACRDFARTG